AEAAAVTFRPSRASGTPVAADGRTDRTPEAHRAMVAMADHADEHEGTGQSNLRKEFDEGRIPAWLRETAELFDELYHTAHLPAARPTIRECHTLGRMTGPERQARASQALRLVQYRCGHLFRDLVRAVVLDESMSSIGLELGGNSKDAARLGRLRLADALVFAHGALADMDRWQRRHEREISSNAPITPILARAIGQKSVAPAWIHEAANDDLRQLKVAA
ncbi:MAG: hypothetical protein K0Q69_1174, partial [Devosia sp.]|nr:hypothetical protein [Devosia sp.]